MSLFVKKSLESLRQEANESGEKTLRRILGPWSLVALGVGIIIGAGLFSITGAVASGFTGPAITISFAIAALGCCFAGLCYAEFASMIPVAGSAYTYSYATMGELVAWIIGWDLVLEYCVAATTVSISWSRYLVVFLEGFGIHLPHALTACPWDGGIVNIPAFVIVVLMSLFLIRGTKGSSIFNGIIVFLKVSVVLIFVILGWKYIQMENYTPYIPENTGKLGEFGFSGILRGAAIVFFAFLGFDAVSTAAQETKNPRRDMPIGILMSLFICTLLYILFAHVMTVSNHRPFTYPAGRIRIPNDSKSRAGGVLYSDYSLGRFFAEAARQPWFENTIFLVTADHCASSAGRTEIPLQKYHIPALILAPGLIEPGVVDGIVSQIDLMPTLLSLLNMSYDSHFYGRSIYDEGYVNRAFIATYQDLGYLEGDVFTILSPVRRFEQYRVVPTEDNPHNLEPMEEENRELVTRAVGYYQTSGEWNKR